MRRCGVTFIREPVPKALVASVDALPARLPMRSDAPEGATEMRHSRCVREYSAQRVAATAQWRAPAVPRQRGDVHHRALLGLRAAQGPPHGHNEVTHPRWRVWRRRPSSREPPPPSCGPDSSTRSRDPHRPRSSPRGRQSQSFLPRRFDAGGRALVWVFSRHRPVLLLSGTWCGAWCCTDAQD